jgi:hypothetical protein
LAETCAGLGNRDCALNFSDRAINVTPSASNSLRLTESRARIAARFGMNDLAIPALERLLKTSYGDPRFEKLAHSDGK